MTAQGSKTILRKLEEISQIFSDMIKAVLPDGSRHTRVKWTKQMFLKLTDKELKKANMGYLVMCFHSLVMEVTTETILLISPFLYEFNMLLNGLTTSQCPH